jgi:hypothetical protein
LDLFCEFDQLMKTIDAESFHQQFIVSLTAALQPFSQSSSYSTVIGADGTAKTKSVSIDSNGNRFVNGIKQTRGHSVQSGKHFAAFPQPYPWPLSARFSPTQNFPFVPVYVIHTPSPTYYGK